ncbi:MAG: HEAT repeat domain-containing protein [Planctomycetota bacterium]|nr:MAG: HEAT repeat domain-containing protein [Planctomycetota bacterium]
MTKTPPSLAHTGLSAIILLIVCASVSVFTACSRGESGEQSQRRYGSPDTVERDRREIRRIVRRLSVADTMHDNPEHEVQFNENRDALIRMGSGVQGILLELLAESEDWGERYGIVHVLSATGTKRMVEPLIQVLNDPEPRVAWIAMHVLRVVCDNQEIPQQGEAGENQLPPVPLAETAAEQRRNWNEWHAVHGSQLREAWTQWWRENQYRVRIE